MHTRRWYRRLQSCEAAPEQNRSLMDASLTLTRAPASRLRYPAHSPLFTQWAGTTTAVTSSIHDAQAAIDFAPLLLDAVFLVGWTAKGAVWLECKIVAREAA